MEIPDLGALLSNLSTAFPLGTQLVLILMGMVGVVVGGLGLMNLYQLADDPFHSRSATGVWGAFGKIILGGALVVTPVLLWKSAETFVLGGSLTYDVFSYLPPTNGGSSPYCEQARMTILLFFIFLGSTAIFHAALIMYAKADGRRQTGTGQAIAFAVSGIVCMFIADASVLVGNTLRMNIGLDNICTLVGNA